MMGAEVLVLLIVVAVIGAALVIFMMTKSGPSRLDVAKYRESWLKIENSIARDNPTACSMAIINADKLLDQALRERGFAGQTMGDRMKSARKTWSNANAVWSAHKLRNKIAHEAHVTVGYRETTSALAGFKRGLKDLGAI